MLGEQVFDKPDEDGYTREAFVRMKLKDYRQHRPPSARNEQIHHAVRVLARSRRSVAAEFGLSHTQVGRIVKAFERWLGETVARAGSGDWMQRKGVTIYLHRERMQHLFGKCLEGFDRSFEDVYSLKTTKVDGKVVKEEGTRRRTQGNWRWAELAMRAEEKRLQFECEGGEIRPPPADEVTDAENKSEVAKIFSQRVYLDRPPTEQELEDARTVHVRLEQERKSLAEDRRLIAIERAELAQLKKEMEEVLAKAKVAEPRPSGSGHDSRCSTSEMSGAAASGSMAPSTPHRENLLGSRSPASCPLPDGRGSVKEQPRPQFTWRFASRDDFRESHRQMLAEERIEATRRRLGFCPPFSSGPPLEVKPGVWIVPEPYPSHSETKAAYKADYLRQEQEAKAEGRRWREPCEKFRKDGSVIQ